MIKLLVFTLFCLLLSTNAFAGGNSSPANVFSATYLSGGKMLFEIKWVKDSGFIDGTKQTKLLFDLYNFNSSVQTEGRMLTEKKNMPFSGFEACVNALLSSYKSGSPVELGQMGGGALKSLDSHSDTVIVPYAKIVGLFNNRKGCLVTTEPLN